MSRLSVAVFIGDFTGYWRHRLEHTRILWPSHAVHHSDTEMTWLTLARFHPFNRLTTFTIDSAVLLWLGLPPFAVIANALVRQYYGYFIHAICLGPMAHWARSSSRPAMHRWHHAKDPRYSRQISPPFFRYLTAFVCPGHAMSPWA